MLKDIINAALPFFSGLPEEEQKNLLSTSIKTTFSKGELVHSGLAECKGVLIVTKGVMRAYLLSEQGKEITLFKLKQGDVCVLTAGCIIKNISFEIFISSETESEAVIIKSKTYNNLKKSYLEVEQFTNNILNQRFSDIMWAIEKILFLSFDKRLALFLLEQIEEKNSLTLKTTHSEIASHIGSAREVVTRMLNYFAGDNILELSKGRIKILNVKKLRNLL